VLLDVLYTVKLKDVIIDYYDIITMPTTTFNEIWSHIISSNNIDLNNSLSIVTSRQIKDSNSTWNGTNNQFEPR